MNLHQISEKDLEVMEKYFEGQLSGMEMEIFETRLNEDQELKALFSFRKELPGLWVNARRIESTRSEISEILVDKDSSGKSFSLSARRPYSDEQPIISFIRNYKLAIAASLVILIGSFFIFRFVSQKESSVMQESAYTIHQPEKESYKGSLEELPEPSPTSSTLLAPKEHSTFFFTQAVGFQWLYKAYSSSHLIIIDIVKGDTAYKAEVQPFQYYLTLKAGTLKPGKYTWFIGDSRIRGEFTIE
jgi:hypothetical protein